MVDIPREIVLAAAPTAAVATAVAPAPDWVDVTDLPARRHVNLWKDAWRRLLRNRLAMAGLCVIVFLMFLTAFADVLMPHDYDFQHFGNIGEGPSWEFPLGTDLVGRDM